MANFKPNEVIHGKFLSLNGKVYGFAPLSLLRYEMETLYDMKLTHRYYWNKGGVPEYIFQFINESPNSPNVEAFVNTLKRYKQTLNKPRSMIITSKEGVKIEKVDPMQKELQFIDLERWVAINV